MSRYSEARKAYEAEAERARITMGTAHTPEPYDLTGGFVFGDYGWILLKNPTKTEAAKIYENLLDYTKYSGWDNYAEPFYLEEE